MRPLSEPIGAVGIGALAIARVAIGRAPVRAPRIERLEIAAIVGPGGTKVPLGVVGGATR